MEALVFALGLRMVRSAMDNDDPQTQQPDSEPGVRIGGVSASPGRAVVQQDALWQAIATESGGEALPNCAGSLIGASLQAHDKAGVVVQDDKGMAAAAVAHGEMPLEAHLPELVGVLVFKALPAAMFEALVGVDEAMATQDSSDSTRTGDSLDAPVREPTLNLAPAPGGVLGPHMQHRCFQLQCRVGRRVVRPTRSVLQTGHPLPPIHRSSHL